jgi:hypothetical protein
MLPNGPLPSDYGPIHVIPLRVPLVVALATYYNPYTLSLHEELNAHWLKLSSALIRPNHAKMLGSVTAKRSGNYVTNTKPRHHYVSE